MHTHTCTHTLQTCLTHGRHRGEVVVGVDALLSERTDGGPVLLAHGCVCVIVCWCVNESAPTHCTPPYLYAPHTPDTHALHLPAPISAWKFLLTALASSFKYWMKPISRRVCVRVHTHIYRYHHIRTCICAHPFECASVDIASVLCSAAASLWQGRPERGIVDCLHKTPYTIHTHT
jgi:hypothetical protein